MASRMASNHNDHERTSLLARPSPASLPPQKQDRRLSSTGVVLLVALWSMCSGCSDDLIQPPQTRLMESIYCRIFYKDDPAVKGPDGQIPEEICKGAWIQSRVASLKGWQLFFECAPALLLAIPFGWFADKYGRRRLLIMLTIAFFARAAWIQFVCWVWPLIPIRFVWLSALHSVFGGSTPVAAAMIFVIISDVSSEAQRAKNFMRVASCIYLTQFLVPPLSAILMRRNPWIPMLLGLILQFCCIPIVACFPETLNYQHHEREVSIERVSSSLSKPHWTTDVRLSLNSFHALMAVDLRIPALLSTFLTHTIIIAATPTLLQYLSTRYSLTLSTSTLIVSIRSASVVAILFSLPYLSRTLTSVTSISALQRDVLMARGSALITAVAYVAIALSPSTPVCIASLLFSTGGSGLYMLIRSILAALVHERDVAKIFSATSVIDTIGMMLGGPGMAVLFGKGLDLGKKWMGLPFFVCASSVSLVAVLCKHCPFVYFQAQVLNHWNIQLTMLLRSVFSIKAEDGRKRVEISENDDDQDSGSTLG